MEMYEQKPGPKSRALEHGKKTAELVIRNSHTQNVARLRGLRAKMDPRPWMKSSPQGASTSGVIQALFLFCASYF